MEDTHGVSWTQRLVINQKVLILIIMEDTHGEIKWSSEMKASSLS